MQNQLKVRLENLITRKDGLLMGRNDLCFCGSGKKQKKCHPNINEDSVAAKIIKLYTQLSKELEGYKSEYLHLLSDMKRGV